MMQQLFIDYWLAVVDFILGSLEAMVADDNEPRL